MRDQTSDQGTSVSSQSADPAPDRSIPTTPTAAATKLQARAALVKIFLLAIAEGHLLLRAWKNLACIICLQCRRGYRQPTRWAAGL